MKSLVVAYKPTICLLLCSIISCKKLLPEKWNDNMMTSQQGHIQKLLELLELAHHYAIFLCSVDVEIEITTSK